MLHFGHVCCSLGMHGSHLLCRLHGLCLRCLDKGGSRDVGVVHPCLSLMYLRSGVCLCMCNGCGGCLAYPIDSSNMGSRVHPFGLVEVDVLLHVLLERHIWPGPSLRTPPSSITMDQRRWRHIMRW